MTAAVSGDALAAYTRCGTMSAWQPQSRISFPTSILLRGDEVA
jgi:hypothetical protein